MEAAAGSGVAPESGAYDDPRGLGVSPGLHEWFGPSERVNAAPPLAVLIDLAWAAIAAESAARASHGRVVMWVGRGVWPYPHALVRRSDAGEGQDDRRLLAGSVFVDASSAADRTWATEQALRCAGVCAVVGDGSGLTMGESRRLHLAAQAGGVPALLARPGHERAVLSAGQTRWLVTPRAEHDEQAGGEMPDRLAWTVELLRCKGLRPVTGGVRRWVVRRHDGTGGTRAWTACDGDLAGEPLARPATPSRPRVA
ncbi:MAG: hypothetical protein SFY69_02885 [Planctomycetota bacterium]|nr:hypothetical protein [Planctomycetota bacterium]